MKIEKVIISKYNESIPYLRSAIKCIKQIGYILYTFLSGHFPRSILAHYIIELEHEYKKHYRCSENLK